MVLPTYKLEYVLYICVYVKVIADNWQELNTYLSDKVYFVGHHITLADVLLYRSLHRIFVSFTIGG